MDKTSTSKSISKTRIALLASAAIVAGVAIYWAGKLTAPGAGSGSLSLFASSEKTCEEAGRSPLELDSQGRGVVDSKAKSSEIIAACASATAKNPDDAASFYRLGRGYELSGQQSEAIAAYEKGEALGNPTAMIRLASLLRNGSPGHPADPQRAASIRAKGIELYTREAENGNPAALFVVGLNDFFDEQGNLKDAARLLMSGKYKPLHEAASRGYAEEVFRIGLMFQRPRGDASSEQLNANYVSDQLFEVASRNGSAPATLELVRRNIYWAEKYAKLGMRPESDTELDRAVERLELARKQGGPDIQKTADQLLAEVRNMQTRDAQAVAAFAALFLAAIANGNTSQPSSNEETPSWGDRYNEMRRRECDYAQANAAWGNGDENFAIATCLF